MNQRAYLGNTHISHNRTTANTALSAIMARIDNEFASYNFSTPHDWRAPLARYVALILRWGDKINLTGTCTIDALCMHLHDVYSAHTIVTDTLKHFVDSGREQSSLRLADLGSGNGMPGIPLALLYPHINMSLVERSSKRIAFLTECHRVLPLSHARIIHAQFQELHDGFDIILTRGLCRFTRKSVAHISRLTKPHGVLLAYKGHDAYLAAEIDALQAQYSQVRAISVSHIHGKEGRVIVIAQ